MAAKRKAAKGPRGKGTKTTVVRAMRAVRAAPPRAAGPDPELRALVADLAVLAAANNLMAQTAFLSLERMRISSEVVDEAISAEFGGQLWDRCEKLVEASDEVILRVLDRAGADDARADLVRGLVQMRRERRGRGAGKPVEQARLMESMERMYR